MWLYETLGFSGTSPRGYMIIIFNYFHHIPVYQQAGQHSYHDVLAKIFILNIITITLTKASPYQWVTHGNLLICVLLDPIINLVILMGFFRYGGRGGSPRVCSNCTNSNN